MTLRSILVLLSLTALALSGSVHLATYAQATHALWLPAIAQEHQAFPAMRLTNETEPATQPALAPDQTEVIYLRSSGGLTDVYAMELNGGLPVNLSQTASAAEDNPIISPDGQHIAFASNRGGDWGVYLMDRDGKNVQVAVDQPGSDEQNPAFFLDSNHLLFASNRAGGNWDIYSTTISSTVWSRLTLSPTVERFPTVANDGLTLAFRRVVTEATGAANSDIFVRDLASGYEQRITTKPGFDGQPVIAPDGSGLLFVSDQDASFNIYGATVAASEVTPFPRPAGWQLQTPRLALDGQSVLFAAGPGAAANLFWRPYASPLQQVAERGFAALGENCDWDAGVLAFGWGLVWRATGDARYQHQLQTWVDGCLAAGQAIDHVNDGLLGYAALIAYDASGDVRYLNLANRVADYLRTAERTPEGAFSHIAGTQTVWDDTLISVIPFYVELSQVRDQASNLDVAVEQVLIHAQLLQDQTTGLYHHAWDSANGRYLGTVYWCRGNSWPLVAIVTLLAVLPADHPQRPVILAGFERQVAALAPLQLSDGRWPTVVTRPDFYAESSGSAMIAYALLRGIRSGWLDAATWGTVTQRARFGIWGQVQADGTVAGVSAQTGPMRNEVDYNNIPISPLELYGQGAVLMLGAAGATPATIIPLYSTTARQNLSTSVQE